MLRLDGILDQVISPRPLLAGVAVGLVACALAGHELGQVNHFRNFQRFTEATDSRTNYHPSAHQLLSLLREKVRPDQIAVIVGGNSVMMGMGQGSEGAWTRSLQAELGDQYCVVNVALPGVGLQEFGSVAAEMLYKSGHHRMILITNTWLHPFSPIGEPDGRPIVWWFYWDAHTRGLLLDSPEREARLALPLNKRLDQGKDSRERDELLRQVRLDRFLNFRDLWNVFEYEVGVTVWCKYLTPSWSRPRKHYPDRDPFRPPSTSASLEPYRQQYMSTMRNAIQAWRPLLRRANGETIPLEQLGGPYPPEETLRTSFPAPIRDRMIVVVNRENPNYIANLTPDERATYTVMGPAMATVYGRTGVTTFEAGRGYDVADYYDPVHLTRAGGRKLASELAPVIRRRAEALGFLGEVRP